MRIIPWRRASWFGAMAVLLAFSLGVLGVVPPDASAGFIPSHGSESRGARDEDLSRLQRFLESEIARRKLRDYGVSPDVAHAKLQEMSDKDLHVLATMAARLPEGGSIELDATDPSTFIGNLFLIALITGAIIGVLIGLVILGVVVVKYMLQKKEEPPEGGGSLEPAPAPAPELAPQPAR